MFIRDYCLIQAISNNKLEAVLELLKTQKQKECIDDAFVEAISSLTKPEIIRALLDAKADVNTKQSYVSTLEQQVLKARNARNLEVIRFSPLEQLILRSQNDFNLETICMLLDAKANVTKRYNDQVNQKMMLVIKNNKSDNSEKVLRALLEAGADVEEALILARFRKQQNLVAVIQNFITEQNSIVKEVLISSNKSGLFYQGQLAESVDPKVVSIIQSYLAP